MRILLLIPFLFFSFSYASIVTKASWPQGESFLLFLKSHNLPQSIYWNLDNSNKELCEEIRAGSTYYVMTPDQNKSDIEQALIPVSSELQIHLYKNLDGKVQFEMIPVIYREITDIFAVPTTSSPYQDIVKATNNRLLAYSFVDAFKKSLDFRTGLRKGDMISIIYKEKLRMGRPYDVPEIEAAMVQMRHKMHYIFLYKGRYYDQKGREVEGFLFRKPVNHVRITSRFSLRRWHPILHIWRAHLGVDFGGRVGTPIMAAAKGRVIYAGWIRGYGNVVKIRHRDGFMTLYAHMHNFRRGIKRGKYVKKGQVIGYIGQTGLATGPHLHFGLYKNGRAINPLGVIHIAKKTLYGSRRKKFLNFAALMKNKLNQAVKEKACPVHLDDLSKTSHCIDEEKEID